MVLLFCFISEEKLVLPNYGHWMVQQHFGLNELSEVFDDGAVQTEIKGHIYLTPNSGHC